MKKLMLIIPLAGMMLYAQPDRAPHAWTPAPGPPPAGFFAPPDMPDMPGWRDESDRHGKVEMMYIWKLTEELELTEKQAEVLFPKMRKHREEIAEIDQQIENILNDLEEKLDNKVDISSNELNGALDKITALEQKKVTAKATFLKDLTTTLSAGQMVEFMEFQKEFKKELQMKLRHVREKKYRKGIRRD